MSKSKVFLLAGAAVALVSSSVPGAAKDVSPTPRYGSFGIDLTAQQKTTRPGDDFWTFANGAWAARAQIAPDRTTAGYWTDLSDGAEKDVRDILTDLAANPAKFGASGKQIGDLYASWMDEAGIEARGTAPLQPYLARIAAVQDKAALQVLFASTGYASPVELGQLPNPLDPTHYTVAASQGTLGMGARDYYLLEGAKYDGFRKAYRAYVIQVQTLAGIPDAAAKADAIIALETAMAKEQWTPERQRNLLEMFRPMNRAQMKVLAPQFDWELMLRTAGLDGQQSVIMATSTALTANGKLFDTVPLQTWKDWVAFNFISDHAQYLPKAFDDANFAFYFKTIRDQPVQRDRWKRGVRLVNGALGEAVGQVYVTRHYPPESEAKMAELIGDLRGALGERLKANAWMDARTKTAALAKLDAFDPRVGHPVKYINYASLQVGRDDILGNAMRSAEFQHRLNLDRLGKPVDRTLWSMTPQTVNAYYDPQMNQITFPAAILQPPFFDPKADAAVNYGAIGAVIGHEIGHGFDDQGSLFDGTGKFSNWWSADSKKAFVARTAVLGKQYDAYEPLPGLHIKGQLTMGENIGDLGGIEMAYAAYQRYQVKHGKARVIGGLSGDQRFFLAWAQVWQEKNREGALRQQVLTNEHSPSFFRVNGVVRNVDAWYAAFHVKPGDALYLAPAERVHIW